MSLAYNYPPSSKSDHVDDYHGAKVPDAYNWLEDPDSNETKEWVESQKSFTDSIFDKIDSRQQIKERLTDLYNYPKIGCPWKEGDVYYFFKNDGLQNQAVMYTQESLDAEPTVFFDPNGLSEDGTISLKTYSFSEKGDLFAYALSKSGSDWSYIQVKSVDPNHELSSKLNEKIEWCKFTGISWDKKGKGFFYSRYPEETGKDSSNSADTDVDDRGTGTGSLKDSSIYYHRIATDQSEDIKIYCDPDQPQWMFSGEVTDEGDYLIVTVSKDTDPINLLYTYPLKDFNPQKGDPVIAVNKVVTSWDAELSYITNEGSLFYFKTNLNAPRYKVISIDLENPARENWKDVIPQSKTDVLSFVTCVNGNRLVVAFVRDVVDILVIFDMEGDQYLELSLPSLGTIVSLSGKKKSSEMFYKFSSFLSPGSTFHYEFKDDQPTTPVLFRETEIEGFNPDDFKATQVFYPSKDGTKIPMFIVSKKDLHLDGSNPVWLYGYGGFSISIQPYFSSSRIVWMQNLNGIFALANIRGGGEYGEEWHKAGTKEKKQNVFDDFHGAAEYLVHEKYTSPNLITINGGSNGGLLVGACVNQRPELYGAAIAAVGVMDMLKFHKFTIGHFWVSDYGSSDEIEDFQYLYQYSPLHNVDASKTYPPLLLTTADHDDRVSPLHSFKYIAELQSKIGANPKQQYPLLIRIEKKAGHGAGKPTKKVIEEQADCYAFVAHFLGLSYSD